MSNLANDRASGPEAGPPRLAQADDGPLLDIVWWGTRQLRLAAHRGRGESRCRSTRPPYGQDDPRAERLHPRCREDGCLDVLHLVYALTVERLGGPGRAGGHRPGYLRRVVETVQVDLRRGERVRHGLPAKPTRGDGVPGRINAALAEQPDPARARWLTTLFRLMRSWVCRLDRTVVQWPLDAWAGEKSAQDGRLRRVGSRAATAELRADVEAVLATCERVAGPDWVNATLRWPLRIVVAPWPEQEPVVAVTGLDVPTNAEVAILVERYALLRLGGAPPRQALERSCASVFGVAPAADADAIIEDLEALWASRRRRVPLHVAHAQPMP